MKRTILYIFLAIIIPTSWCSCTDHDRTFDDMMPQEIHPNSCTVCGIVTDRHGNPISGAEVQIGDKLTKTDKGLYSISGMKVGDYAILIKSNGMVPMEGHLTVVQSFDHQIIPFNTTLQSASHASSATISAPEGGSINIVTPSIEGNVKAQIPIRLEAPANCLSADATLMLRDLHPGRLTSNDSTVTSDEMLVGFTISGKETELLFRQPAIVTLTLDKDLASHAVIKELSGSSWNTINSQADGNEVHFNVAGFGTYGLFAPIRIIEENSQSNISFEQRYFDNMYGAKGLEVDSIFYTLNMGAMPNTGSKSVLLALLAEKMASTYGGANAEMEDYCLLNTIVPVGICLRMNGSQEKKRISATAFGQTIKMTAYGCTRVSVTEYDREGTGGSN